ncbi:hypothetical protein GUITHDRAFT_148757 [Guillardia theta CCMP2712]|uniref:Uncharacterized protein n=1 Tax=Guillardia theta (strain CCMP2712) TaxID=905079 RepID=L1I848_GUITC|nr:hypothetical protein GUITHDRAFT_148757 [Guillardia theta CCMP2712]EKX32252.1 hypothetical protein GUITHDRAFT_148757 [Guillardia theta CCMP2712]|eukprot:XP_005819232.1 hypothetical protein GUITHDRAFT_148757 [Guillardia theta CCMP2712]
MASEIVERKRCDGMRRRWRGILTIPVQSLYTGKGIRPKSGQPLIQAEWLASKSDLLAKAMLEAELLFVAFQFFATQLHIIAVSSAVRERENLLVGSMKPKTDTVAIATNQYQRRSTELRQQSMRDWDIVTPPGSPTHMHEFCELAQISLRHDVDKFPLLPPAAPSQQVAPFRGQGEKACTIRLRQFDEMEHQRVGTPLSNS